jgi:shikimate dehydrogenase
VTSVPYAEVIGDPIAHSKSPLIHEFWLGKLGLEGEYRKTSVASTGLGAFLSARLADPQWRGCNVTMPHKQSVLRFVASLADEAAQAGAANLLVREENVGIRGFNTDVTAVATLLRDVPAPRYPNHVSTYVQIIGAGGAARAAAVGASLAGHSDLDFFNRTVAKAEELARWIGMPPDGHAAPLEALAPIRNQGDGPEEQRYSHILINASSMGMTGNPPVPVDLRRYYPDTVLVEMVYSPLETPLLRQAKARGFRVIDGLQVLVEQAAAAFNQLFGAEAPRQHDAELRELLTA